MFLTLDAKATELTVPSVVDRYLGYFFIAGIAVYRSTAGYRKTEQETNDGLYPAYRQRNTIKTMTAAMFYA